jgi:hypothetical protein
MFIKEITHNFYQITSFPEQKIKGKGRWKVLLKGLAISLIGIPLSAYVYVSHSDNLQRMWLLHQEYSG